MKKFLSLTMVALALSTTLSASSDTKTKPTPVVYKSCMMQALNMFDDMIGCGMGAVTAANYAINHYNYCMDSRVAQSMGVGLNHL